MDEDRALYTFMRPPGGALDEALEAVAALGRLGLVLTYNWPTKEMIDAGAAAGGVSPDQAIEIYRAMVKASTMD